MPVEIQWGVNIYRTLIGLGQVAGGQEKIPFIRSKNPLSVSSRRT